MPRRPGAATDFDSVAALSDRLRGLAARLHAKNRIHLGEQSYAWELAELLDRIGRDNFFINLPSNPTVATRNALRRAHELLGRRDGEIHIFVDKRKQEAKEKESG